MKKEITDEELIELLEGAENPALEQAIKNDSDISRRFEELQDLMQLMEDSKPVEVPSHIQVNVENALRAEQLRSQKTGSWSWMQIAAAVAFLVVGFVFWKFSAPDQSSQLAALNDEIRSLREVTLTSALQKHSASERILA